MYNEEEKDEFDDDNIVRLKDKNGEYKYEFFCIISYNNSNYGIFIPLSKNLSNIVILKQKSIEKDNIVYSEIKDDNELNNVFNIFKEKYKDDFNFEN